MHIHSVAVETGRIKHSASLLIKLTPTPHYVAFML